MSRHLRIFKKSGVKNFCLVSGYRSEALEAQLDSLREAHDVKIDHRHNERYDLENGFSVSKAMEWVKDQGITDFFMTMGDHIFHEDFVSSFIKESAGLKTDLQLAVDIPGKMNEHIDIDDVTKVQADSDMFIRSIGKGITQYNYYDTGLFRLKANVFNVLQNCFDQERFTISDMVTDLIDSDQAKGTLVTGFTWNDVDNRDDLESTLALIKEGRL